MCCRVCEKKADIDAKFCEGCGTELMFSKTKKHICSKKKGIFFCGCNIVLIAMCLILISQKVYAMASVYQNDDKRIEHLSWQIDNLYVSIGDIKKKASLKDEEKIYCPTCSAEIFKNAKVCKKCGTVIKYEKDMVMNICPKCQSEVGANDKFCAMCGNYMK